jgi:hypothetical protein
MAVGFLRTDAMTLKYGEAGPTFKYFQEKHFRIKLLYEATEEFFRGHL